MPTPPLTGPGPSRVFRNRWDLIAASPETAYSPLSVVVSSPSPLPVDILATLLERLDDGCDVEVLVPRGSDLPDGSMLADGIVLGFIDAPDPDDPGSLRNAAVEQAQHEVLLFLEAGSLPSPGWLGAHGAWHARASDLVVIGRTLSEDGREPDWITGHRLRTRNLTAESADLYRYFPTSNVSMRRDTLLRSGGFSTHDLTVANEDALFGYRLFQSGAVFVAAEAEVRLQRGGAWPERRPAPGPEKTARLAHLIANRSSRHVVPGRTYEVPFWDVTVDAMAATMPELSATVECLLGSMTHDVLVRLQTPPNHELNRWARAAFGPDPRVVFGGHPNPLTPFRLQVPAGITCSPSALSNLELAFAEDTDPAGVLQITVPGHSPAGRSVRAVSARAFHRATSDEIADPYQAAADLSGQRWLSGQTMGIGIRPDSPAELSQPVPDPAAAGIQSDELRDLWDAVSSLNPAERSALLGIGRRLLRTPGWVRRLLVRVGRVVLRA